MQEVHIFLAASLMVIQWGAYVLARTLYEYTS